jgi:hypothetical protein
MLFFKYLENKLIQMVHYISQHCLNTIKILFIGNLILK